VKRIKVNGVESCAQTSGDPADPPVLLAGVTMLSWPDGLCAALAGRYVVRYDLRDAGQSTFADPDAPAYNLRDLVAARFQQPVHRPPHRATRDPAHRGRLSPATPTTGG
jgi:hypothetical protein